MKHLVAYITSGFPETSFTTDLALALGENGVDSLELGVPFSDPVADGPVIEAANHLALQNGLKFADVMAIAKTVAPNVDTLLMGYFNPFYQHNMDKLLSECSAYGVSGLIIPDLPFEEANLYAHQFNKHGVANISFVAPTDSPQRIRQITADAKKFIYLVAYAGITGTDQKEELQPLIDTIKMTTDTPVYVGFGVNEKTAKEKVQGADGVIVGSAFVNILLREELNYSQKIARCSELASTLKALINE